MQLLKKPFLQERFPDACCVYLAVPGGVTVILSSVGAAVRAVLCPRPDGSLKNIALSFADDGALAGNGLYAGAVLAPAAGRISGGRLPVAGRTCALTRNENGVHTLHGGSENASFRNWTLEETACMPEGAGARFSLTLPDGLDGFPGNRQLCADYRLSPEGELTLVLTGTSDKETYFNLSSHCYFNLSGCFGRDACDHALQINAGRFVTNRPDFIPSGTAPAAGTPFDFTSSRTLRSQLEAFPGDGQIAANCGWNHGFVFNEKRVGADALCTLPGTGAALAMDSDAPCMVLYSGGYIPEGLTLLSGVTAQGAARLARALGRGDAEERESVPDGAQSEPAAEESGGAALHSGLCAGLFPAGEIETQRSVPACALAFEFQDYPDAPGGHGFPYRTARAGETVSRRIRWCFMP